MIDKKSYPILIMITAFVAASFLLTAALLLHSVFVGTTREGRECRKAVKEYLRQENSYSGLSRIIVEDIRPIDDLGRFTDPEWSFCDTMKDSLRSLIRNLPAEEIGRREYLERKRSELADSGKDEKVFIQEQVSWLERLQGKELKNEVVAHLHEDAWAFEKKSMNLMREPGREFHVTVKTGTKSKRYVFVSPADVVVLTDISKLVN